MTTPARWAPWLVAALHLLSPSLAAGDEPNRYQSVVHARPKREDGTSLVVTGRELADRGVNNLAEALELLPEVQVREGGRGDTRVDLRGARQRSLLILIDGAVVDEPYLGTFDLTGIPVTDIVEVRVTLSPASPLEGPGGDSGVIEVQTLRATGNRRLDARVRGSTSPEGQAAITGRTPLGGGVALRASVGGRYGDPIYPALAATGQVDFHDTQSQAHAGLRLEYQARDWHLTGDGWYQHRTFYVPPNDASGAAVQQVLGEDSVRAIVGAELERNQWRLAVGAYATVFSRSARNFPDYSLNAANSSLEDLSANREGAAVHVDRSLRLGELSLRFSGRLSIDTQGATIRTTDAVTMKVHPASGRSSFGELALGLGVKWRWLRLDAAFGQVLPFDDPRAQWQEGKLSMTFAPNRWVQIIVVGARKGRVPTLRELYDPLTGNANLAPEQTWYGEVQAQAKPHKLVSVRATGYYRRTEGLIKLGILDNMSKSVNFDAIDVRGIEAVIDVARDRIVGGGAAYIYADPTQLSNGDVTKGAGVYLNPLDNFPKHRFEAWISSTWKRRFGVQFRVRYVGQRFDKTVPLHDYVLGELDGWVKIVKWLRMNARVDNLWNTRYDLHAGLQSLPASFSLAFEGTWE